MTRRKRSIGGRKAADQGLDEAEYSLGLAYSTGQGVTQDYAEAAKWYRRAAEQGEGEAEYNLGVRYAKGEGVEQDLLIAYMWFNLASSSPIGLVEAAANKGKAQVAQSLSADEIAQAEAMTSKCREQQFRNCGR